MSFKRNGSIRKSMGTWITGTWIRDNPRVIFSNNEKVEASELNDETIETPIIIDEGEREEPFTEKVEADKNELKDETIETPIIIVDGEREEPITEKEQPVKSIPTKQKRSGSNKCLAILAVLSIVIALIAIGLSIVVAVLQFSQPHSIVVAVIQFSQPHSIVVAVNQTQDVPDQLLEGQYGDQLAALLSQIPPPVDPYSNCTEEVRNCTVVSGMVIWTTCITAALPLDSMGYYNTDVRCYATANSLVVTSIKREGKGGVQCVCSLINEPLANGLDATFNQYATCTLAVRKCPRYWTPFDY